MRCLREFIGDSSPAASVEGARRSVFTHCTASPYHTAAGFVLGAAKRVTSGWWQELPPYPPRVGQECGFHRGRAPDLQIFVTSPAGGRFPAGELTRRGPQLFATSAIAGGAEAH